MVIAIDLMSYPLCNLKLCFGLCASYAATELSGDASKNYIIYLF
jgi:hypothetical protein